MEMGVFIVGVLLVGGGYGIEVQRDGGGRHHSVSWTEPLLFLCQLLFCLNSQLLYPEGKACTSLCRTGMAGLGVLAMVAGVLLPLGAVMLGE